MDANERRQRVADEAAEWWVTLQGEHSRAEREQYVDWLRESGLHVAEMLRVAQVHGALKDFERWAEVPSDGLDDDGNTVVPLPPAERSVPTPESTKHSSWPIRIAWALAATLLVSMGLTAALLTWRSPVIQTERGERREVALADGSVLDIDPETRLKVAFDEHTRRVVLETGRAMFKVAKNRERPFLVQADGTTVRAVGTAFGVERQRLGVVVTVAEGQVGVFSSEAVATEAVKGASRATSGASTERALSPAPVMSKAHPEILLTAGQQLTMPSSGAAEPVRSVDSDRELAWAKGRLVLDNETVADAVEEFNRYNRIQLQVSDTVLAARRVSGVFDASDPESFIAFLQTVASVHVRRSDSEIIMQ